MDHNTYAYVMTYVVAQVTCLLLLVFLYAEMNANIASKPERDAFHAGVLSQAAVDVMEMLELLGSVHVLTISHSLFMILHMIEFFSIVLTLYFLYECLRLKILPKRVLSNKKLIRIMRIPLLVSFIGNLLTPFVHFFYFIDAHDVYHRGPFYFVHILCLVFYVAVIFGMMLYWQRHDTKKKKEIGKLKILLFIPILGIGLQLIFPHAPFSSFACLIGTFAVFIGTQAISVSTDSLTTLNNRARSESYLNHRNENASHEPFYLFMCDADDFKQINDLYGHVVGDEALKCVADTLKKIGSHYHHFFASRYGGDEFLFVISADEEEPEILMYKITEELKTMAHVHDLPFPLSLSMGYTYVSTTRDVKEIINEADDDLYRHKKHKKATEDYQMLYQKYYTKRYEEAQ